MPTIACGSITIRLISPPPPPAPRPPTRAPPAPPPRPRPRPPPPPPPPPPPAPAAEAPPVPAAPVAIPPNPPLPALLPPAPPAIPPPPPAPAPPVVPPPPAAPAAPPAPRVDPTPPLLHAIAANTSSAEPARTPRGPERLRTTRTMVTCIRFMGGPPANRIDEMANALARTGRIDHLERELQRFDPKALNHTERESWYHLWGIAAFN